MEVDSVDVNFLHFFFLIAGTGIRLSQAGFAMFGIDYEGHGKSEGVPGLVMNFDRVIDDCLQHFSTISGLFLLLLSPSLFSCQFVPCH